MANKAVVPCLLLCFLFATLFISTANGSTTFSSNPTDDAQDALLITRFVKRDQERVQHFAARRGGLTQMQMQDEPLKPRVPDLRHIAVARIPCSLVPHMPGCNKFQKLGKNKFIF